MLPKESPVVNGSAAETPASTPINTPLPPSRPSAEQPGKGARLLQAAWPKLLALAIFLVLWQIIVLTGWKPRYLLPGPGEVLARLGELIHQPTFTASVARTLTRAAIGFSFAMVIGTFVGVAVARFRVVRTAMGSLITGLQTMPSVVWFPLAILLLGLGEQAITFVVVLGAAPSIANGVISGIDHVPPAFTRLGHILGARGTRLYWHIILPASLPAYVTGLNQGWAFAWRSLMAGELLVTIPGATSLGSRLAFAQELNNATDLLAYMAVILVLGMLADAVFSAASRTIRARRGLSTH